MESSENYSEIDLERYFRQADASFDLYFDNTEDADIVLVSFGSTSRNVKTAMKKLREKGIKAGILRPITLFPFPSKRLEELSKTVKRFVTVEVNMGQMVNDVRLAVNGACPVDLVNKGVGAPPSADEIVKRIEELI